MSTRIEVYLSQPVKSTYKGYEPVGPQEITFVINKGKTVVGVRQLGSNVIKLSTAYEDAQYCYRLVKKFK